MALESDGVLRQLLEKGFQGTQAELCNELREYGVSIEQSGLSRALARLGAVRRKANGKTLYVLPKEGNQRSKGSDRFHELIVSIVSNESLILVRTLAGAAQFIAAITEHKLKNEIRGTLAGDDTLLIIPVSTEEIPYLLATVKTALS